MRRREFIRLLGGATVVWPLAAHAQQPDRMRRIGVLMGYPESDSEAQAYIAAFREGLQKLGWAEGRNIRIDYRWATPSKLSIVARPTPVNLTPPGELIPKPMGWLDPGVTPCCKTIFGGASNMSSTGSGGPVRGDSLRKWPASRG